MENEYTINLEKPDVNCVCRGSGTLQIPRYIADSLVALTFKLVYTASLPVDKF
jgi:hypothetical protein